MSTLKQDNQERDPLKEAGEWLARLAASDVTEKERADFEAWLAQDPEHVKAFEDLNALDVDLSALGAFSSLDSAVLSSEMRVAQEEALEISSRGDGHRDHLPASIWYGVAAAVSLVAVGLSLWLVVFNVDPTAQAATYTTVVGEQEEVMLSDGSIVSLNTASSLSVAFTEKQRTIYFTSGEAYFQVAKDSARPFVIHAGDEVVEAVGTAFSVYHRDETIRVSVVEGTVAFGGAPGQGMHDIYRQDETGTVIAQRIDRGQSLVFRQGEALARVYEDTGVETVASWRQGKLYFDRTPLADIIKEVNYYIPQRIVIADQSLADYRGSGVFQIDNAESIVNAFEAAWPVKIVRQSPDVVLLYGAD